jgi:uncharacterized protein YjiS (DUF1127 family)
MTKRDTPRDRTAARAATLPGAATAAGPIEVLDALDAFFTRLGEHVRKRDRQRKAARELARMSDHALRDIDLHRSEILSATHNLERFKRYDDRRPPPGRRAA